MTASLTGEGIDGLARPPARPARGQEARNAVIRLQVRCRGTVQGVGFRPTVHRVATSLGLAGWVINDPLGATLEIEGPEATVELFVDRLVAELPPLARLDEVEREPREPLGETGFEVRTSTLGRREGALVPPDSVVCSDCRTDMASPRDRRFHYPFTTCTNCGPRFSLVRSLPYDRERTSMACFPFCPDCEREYDDPTDRRFHAEPVACPACGPRLWLADAAGADTGVGEPDVRGARELLAGRIVARQGDRGFPAGLSRRLERGGRTAARTQATIRQAVCRHGPRSRGGPRSGRARPGVGGVDGVGQGADRPRAAKGSRPRSPRRWRRVSSDLGVMVPTTPLHIELLRDPPMPPLVMTSGNLSEEPLCRGNREAVDRLRGIADCFSAPRPGHRPTGRRLGGAVVAERAHHGAPGPRLGPGADPPAGASRPCGGGRNRRPPAGDCLRDPGTPGLSLATRGRPRFRRRHVPSSPR